MVAPFEPWPKCASFSVSSSPHDHAVSVPARQVIQFKAYYTKVDVADVDDLFTLANRSLPGQLSETEFFIAMALTAVAQQVGMSGQIWVQMWFAIYL